MNPEAEELIDVLERIIALLDSDGDTHWSAWMRRAKARLEDRDHRGAHDLLDAYGGMGSYSDFDLGRVFLDGEMTWKPDHNELNAKLDRLRSRAYELAIRMR